MFKRVSAVRRRPTRSSRPGLTLVELLLTVVIIGILGAIIMPKFIGQTDDARIATTKANLETLRSAVRMFMANNRGAAPAALQELVPDYVRAIPEEAITPSNAVKGWPRNGKGGWVYDTRFGEALVLVNLNGKDANVDSYHDY